MHRQRTGGRKLCPTSGASVRTHGGRQRPSAARVPTAYGAAGASTNANANNTATVTSSTGNNYEYPRYGLGPLGRGSADVRKPRCPTQRRQREAGEVGDLLLRHLELVRQQPHPRKAVPTGRLLKRASNVPGVRRTSLARYLSRAHTSRYETEVARSRARSAASASQRSSRRHPAMQRITRM